MTVLVSIFFSMTGFAGPVGIDLGEDNVPLIRHRMPAQSAKGGFFTPQNSCPVFATEALETAVGKLAAGRKIWVEPTDSAVRIFRTSGPAFISSDCQ